MKESVIDDTANKVLLVKASKLLSSDFASALPRLPLMPAKALRYFSTLGM
jgi:hypothetical protein